MTAGQIAAPYRQLRTSLLVAALAVAFSLGLLLGLVAQRVAISGGRAATIVGVPAAVAGANARAGAISDGQNFRGAQDFRAATGSVGVAPVLDTSLPYLTVQGGVVIPGIGSATGSVDTGAQNLRGAQDVRAAARASSIGVAPAPDPARLSTSGTGWSRDIHPL